MNGIIMRPSSLGGGRILRRTSVCPSVRPSRYRASPSVTSRHLANYNDTHVLFSTRWESHIRYRTAISILNIGEPAKLEFDGAGRLGMEGVADRLKQALPHMCYQLTTHNLVVLL